MMDELHMPHLVCVSMLLQNVYPRIQYLWGDWNLIEQPLKCARKMIGICTTLFCNFYKMPILYPMQIDK